MVEWRNPHIPPQWNCFEAPPKQGRKRFQACSGMYAYMFRHEDGR